MATARWARLVLAGDRPTGNFAGEIWQTGISMVDQDSGGVLPGAVRNPLPSFNTQIIGQATTDATWRTDWAWQGTDKFTQANQLALANHALTFFNVIKAHMPTDSRLLEVRLSAIDATGHVINGANVFTLLTPVAGTVNATSQVPAQLAITASLRTGARGSGGRGRMFLPCNGVSSSGGLIGTTPRDAVGNGVKALCQNIRAVGPMPAVVNRAPLTYSDVDDVLVGNYFDVQRRREASKDETYTQYTPSYS